jgi:hypothetical protein
MAIVRCQDHPPQVKHYALAVKPVGYPDTALVCGRGDSTHDEHAWVYLLPDEREAYEEGQRVFGLWGPDSDSGAAKVRVSDETVEGLKKWATDESASSGLQSQSTFGRY